MGLQADNQEKRIFLNIVAGKFAKKVTADTEGAVERETKDQHDNKKIVHELLYKSLSGMIDSIEVDETGKFGDQLKINMSDGLDKFTVSFSMQSREAKHFLVRLPHIDIKAEVVLAPYNFVADNNDNIIGMNVFQEEKKLLPFYSNDNPNGMPVPPKIEEGKLDKDEYKLLMAQQTIFLKKMAKKFILENFAEKSNRMPPNEKVVEESYKGKRHTDGHGVAPWEEEKVDDGSGLPF